MRLLNSVSHAAFLNVRLRQLLTSGSFAALAWRQIGANIDQIGDDYDDTDKIRAALRGPVIPT